MTSVDMTFLVEFLSVPGGFKARSAAAHIEVLEATRDAAMDAMRSALDDHAKAVLVPQVVAIGQHADGSVTCPEGFVHLAADDWFCKVTKSRCPIGAVVSLSRLPEFGAGCNAPTDTREGVVGALRAGYQGVHHVPGKYLCPTCLRREEDRYKSGMAANHYYYRFELQVLSDFVPSLASDAGRLSSRRALIQAGRDLRILNHHVCPRCLFGAIEFLDPATQGHFEVVALRVPVP